MVQNDLRKAGLAKAIDEASAAGKTILPITVGDIETDKKKTAVKIFVGEGTELQLLASGSYFEIAGVPEEALKPLWSSQSITTALLIVVTGVCLKVHLLTKGIQQK